MDFSHSEWELYRALLELRPARESLVWDPAFIQPILKSSECLTEHDKVENHKRVVERKVWSARIRKVCYHIAELNDYSVHICWTPRGECIIEFR